jgi:hypothetical protein
MIRVSIDSKRSHGALRDPEMGLCSFPTRQMRLRAVRCQVRVGGAVRLLKYSPITGRSALTDTRPVREIAACSAYPPVGLVDWRPWKHVGFWFGYRALCQDYKTGSGPEFAFDATMHGPVIALNTN